MKEDKEKEIAVIFEKEVYDNGVVIHHPIKMLIGYLNEENLFVTKKGDFHYITDLDYVYGFAMRQPLEKFKETIQSTRKTIKKDIKMYLEELQEYIFFLTSQDNEEFTDLILLSAPSSIMNKRDDEETVTYIVPDIDIEIGKEILKKKAKEVAKEKAALEEINSKSKKEVKIDFDPKALSDKIKEVVIGQDEQIDDIVTIMWQNCKSNTKNNILLVGPTGTGKTEIIRNMSKHLGIPMTTFNVSDTSQAAYIGPSLSSAIAQLVKAADNDIEKASHGIIFLDEIDKKASTNGYLSDVMTSGLQDELLKLLEDNDYQVNISDNPMQPKMVTINTKNITFICAGAFSEMGKIKKEKASLGFNAKITTTDYNYTDPIVPEDLVKYGLKPELVGRLHNIIQLSPLTKENLITIMKNPNNQSIQEKRNILESLGIKLNLNEDVYSYIADNAIKKKTGARGIIGEVDKLFLKAMKEISQASDKEDLSELIIDQNTVTDQHAYKLVRKKKI